MFEGHDELLQELAVSPGTNYIGYVGRNNRPVLSGQRRPLPKTHADFVTHPIDSTAVHYENAGRLQRAKGINDRTKFVRVLEEMGLDELFKKQYIKIRPVTNATTDRDVREAEQLEIERVSRRTGYELVNGVAAAQTESAKRKRIEDVKQRDKERKKLQKKREMAFG